MWASFVVVLFGFVAVNAHKLLSLPDYLKPCKMNSPDFDACCLEHAKLGLPYIVKGDKTYGIPNFNPLKITEVSLGEDGKFKFQLTDISSYGLADVVLKDFKINLKDKSFLLELTVPVLTILGNYSMDGKILVLPLKGNGHANITATDVYVKVEFGFEYVKRHGNDFVSVTKDNVHFEPKWAHFELENLLGDTDKKYGDPLTLVNKEWQSVISVMGKPIGKCISEIAKSIMNGIFENVPLKNIFLE